MWIISRRSGGTIRCEQTDYFKIGTRRFQNKRILKNNLCLPTCILAI